MKHTIRLTITGILLLGSLISFAQFTESFSDGNYTANPVWTPSGGTDWIVNSAGQLQSNNTTTSTSFYISTPNTLATTAEWQFWDSIAFNPSSANYIDVFLTASASDVTLTSATGYFVRIGNTNDEICLYRKDAGGSVTKIIDGVDGILNTSNSQARVKVIRDASNQWTLFRDLSGTGNSFTSEGSVTDATYATSTFFAIYIKQSTSSFVQKHFFDDIIVKPYAPDITPPAIVSATAVSSTGLDVLFSEPVDLVTSQQASNYTVNTIGSPITANRDAANNALVHLTFANSFVNGIVLTLLVNGVKDLAGNALLNGSATFSFYTPQRYDVVIDEIMADPTPMQGLPDIEWLELKNTSSSPVNLAGWKLLKGTTFTGAMPAYTLKPDSFVVVCASGSQPFMSSFGPAISVTSFPAITNTGDLISLVTPGGNIVHTVNYTDDWYGDPAKKDGGWTLEMIDTKNPCSGAENWRASIDKLGGTPSRKNSVDGVNPDRVIPKLMRAYPRARNVIVAVYDVPMDSTSVTTVGAYSLSDGLGITSVNAAGPFFSTAILNLSSPIDSNKIYTLSVSGVASCSGNILQEGSVAFGIPSFPDTTDIVINEILFNPKPDGVDYVELYNRSNKIINLKQLIIGNCDIGNKYRISQDTILLFPSGYALLTTDANAVMHDYVSEPKSFVVMNTLPSFNNDKGCVVLRNETNAIVDEVDYSEKWHFPLIDNDEGVSLERLSFTGKPDQSNFHSAASSVGYGTPGYKNSQFTPDKEIPGEVTIDPQVFSPDNDGHDDVLTLNYQFPSPGYFTNITIYNSAGRPVRFLERNALCGIKGYFRWDGLDEKQQKLPVGIYIVVAECMNTEGKRKVIKLNAVLARKM